MDRNLAQRIGFAAVAIPLALAIVWYGGWPLALLVALVAALGVRELFGLFRKTGGRAIEVLGLLAAIAVPITGFLAIAGDIRLAAGSASQPPSGCWSCWPRHWRRMRPPQNRSRPSA